MEVSQLVLALVIANPFVLLVPLVLLMGAPYTVCVMARWCAWSVRERRRRRAAKARRLRDLHVLSKILAGCILAGATPEQIRGARAPVAQKS